MAKICRALFSLYLDQLAVWTLPVKSGPDLQGVCSGCIWISYDNVELKASRQIAQGVLISMLQGAVQGALQGARALAQGLGPLIFAGLFALFTKSWSPLPYFPGIKPQPLLPCCAAAFLLPWQLTLALPRLFKNLDAGSLTIPPSDSANLISSFPPCFILVFKFWPLPSFPPERLPGKMTVHPVSSHHSSLASIQPVTDPCSSEALTAQSGVCRGAVCLRNGSVGDRPGGGHDNRQRPCRWGHEQQRCCRHRAPSFARCNAFLRLTLMHLMGGTERGGKSLKFGADCRFIHCS